MKKILETLKVYFAIKPILESGVLKRIFVWFTGKILEGLVKRKAV